MTVVIKRDGTKQAFSGAKLKKAIIKSAKEAKLTPSKAKALANEVAEPVIKLAKRRARIKAVDIRKIVLAKLESRSKATVSAWKVHERKKARKAKKARK